MSEYRYILEPYAGHVSRHLCPGCQHRTKTFSRYIDTETGAALNSAAGKCNREINCGYHYTPKQYFLDNPNSSDTITPRQHPRLKPPPLHRPVAFIPSATFEASRKNFDNNNLTRYLVSVFGDDIARELIARYCIGTSKRWPGSTVFWYITEHGNIIDGKVMLYNAASGKRTDNLTWVHKLIKTEKPDLRRWMFGEHLLTDKTKPVAIVESEKTAIIASAYLPQFIWLAVGGLAGLNADRIDKLRGRRVVLFPDLSKPQPGKPTAFEQWTNKADELSYIATFTVSDLLEQYANEAERIKGLDLADYLLMHPVTAFAVLNPPPEQAPVMSNKPDMIQKMVQAFDLVPDPNPIADVITIPAKPTWQQTCESWTNEVDDLEKYFKAAKLPASLVKLDQSSTITDIPLFIAAHMATVRANDGNRTYLPYLNRLKILKECISSQPIY